MEELFEVQEKVPPVGLTLLVLQEPSSVLGKFVVPSVRCVVSHDKLTVTLVPPEPFPNC